MARIIKGVLVNLFMIIPVSIRGDQPNTWKRSGGDVVNERLLTCLDMSKESPVLNTFEFLDKDLPFNAPSMEGKTADLHVKGFENRAQGVRLVGKLVVRGLQS
jgi:hypothetical protein